MAAEQEIKSTWTECILNIWVIVPHSYGMTQGCQNTVRLFYKYKGIYETTSFSNSDYQIFSALMHFLCLAGELLLPKSKQEANNIVSCLYIFGTYRFLTTLPVANDRSLFLLVNRELII